MKCPNCNTSLVMSDRQGIEIDYCPDCRGVWLDRGELDKIIERSNQEIESVKKKKDRDDDYYDDDDSPAFGISRKGQPKKKKKMSGMLGDLFEF
jgi:Zn-finger nucleic acid-binding protein